MASRYERSLRGALCRDWSFESWFVRSLSAWRKWAGDGRRVRWVVSSSDFGVAWDWSSDWGWTGSSRGKLWGWPDRCKRTGAWLTTSIGSLHGRSFHSVPSGTDSSIWLSNSLRGALPTLRCWGTLLWFVTGAIWETLGFSERSCLIVVRV